MSFTKPTSTGRDYPTQVGRLVDIVEGPALRNFIRNGDFQIAQRGTSFAGITTAQYCLDGFHHSAAGTQTVSQQTFTVGQTDVPGNPINFLRVQRTVAGGTNNVVVQFPIEFPQRLSGKTVTLSFWAKVASGTKAFSIDATNTGITPGAYPMLPATEFTATTTWTLFKFTSTIEKMTAATANAAIFPRIYESSTPGTYTLDIADVQLELGSEATYFERLNYEQQLAWAQRFLPGFRALGTTEGIPGAGSAGSTTTSLIVVPFRVRARVAVTGIAISGGTHVTLNDGVTTTASTGVAFSYGGADAAAVIVTVASGLTQYRPYTAYFNNASGSLLFTGAEL